MEPFYRPTMARRTETSKPVLTSAGAQQQEAHEEEKDMGGLHAVVVSPLRSPTKRKTPHTMKAPKKASSAFPFESSRALDSPRLLEIGVVPMVTPKSLVSSQTVKTQVKGLLPPSIAEKEAQRAATLKAMALIAFSAFIYSLQSLNVKILGGHMDPLTITMFRGIVGAAFSITSLLASRIRNVEGSPPLWGAPENCGMLLLRGLLGGITIASAFYAVSELDLAMASTIIFTAPLWTAALACIFEKGSWTAIDTFSALCCLIGMVLITRPSIIFERPSGQKDMSVAGITAALVSAITAAGVNLTIRRLKSEDAATITLYAMAGSIIVVLPGLLWSQAAGPTSPLWSADWTTLGQLCLTGFFSWLAQMTKTSGLKLSKSLGVLVMRYLDIVFSFIWDSAILDAPIDPYGAAGAVTIFAGCLFSIIVKGQGNPISACRRQRRRFESL